MLRLVCSILLIAACSGATPDDDCARAAEHVAACFPGHAAPATCDPSTAEAVAEMSCDELASWEGKADNPYCFWMPWLCSGSSSRPRIEVAVDECGPGVLCPYVQSAACGLVTLEDSRGDEVARGYSNANGRLTFDVPRGEYTVRVLRRTGTLARMHPDEFSEASAPAKVEVEVGSGDPPWARFELGNGEAEQIDSCSQLRGNLTVMRGGTAVAPRDVEWAWLVELETADGATQLTRPVYIDPDRNALAFFLVRRGVHTLRFIPMDIPSYEQKPNPDYARLRRLYATDDAPIEVSVEVASDDLAGELDVSQVIDDPR